ncbi:hypothetical protein N7486_003995 [Penicillium sp. IBT 16267x]|nr:hypothetical protein N7486_003995 [Penicillium sp. IBT 16267x]
MDPDKKVRSGPRSPGSPAERRSTFSLPFVFKTPSRRPSIIGPPDLSPTCAERGHYPVFNPLDPRHNPSATPLWRRQESHTSSSDSQKQSHWVQDFPRRSLHKARSGLLALRAGFLRRHRPSRSVEITSAHHAEASSASTQEDLSFGVALYRTNVPWPLTQDEPSIDVLMRAAAFHPLANIASAPEVRVIPTWGFHDAEAVFSHDVSMAFHPPASNTSYDGIFDPQDSHSHEVGADMNDQKTDYMERETKSVHEAHSLASTGWETIESSSTNSTGAEAESLRDVDNAQAAYSQEQIAPLNSNRSILINDNLSMSHEEIKSDDELHGSPSLNRQILENRRGSFMRHSSGKSSAEVPVAFPGAYHALLEQWAPTTLPSPTVNFLLDSPHQIYEESISFDPLNSNPQQMESSLPQLDQRHDRWALDDEEPIPTSEASGPFMTGNDAFIFNTNIDMQPDSVISAQPEERRHAFGLHISMINEPRLDTSRDQILPLQNQMYQQQYGETNYSSAPIWGYDAAESMFQSSTQSSIYTRGSTMSPEFTSVASFSDMCSPLNSPIDEEVLFSNPFRNEFWNADGKTSSFYPDRGDQPVKAELRVARDGGVHSGRGLDRIPSSREHQSPGIRMPTAAPHSSQGTVRAVVMREDSESTDEFYPGCHVPERYRR